MMERIDLQFLCRGALLQFEILLRLDSRCENISELSRMPPSPRFQSRSFRLKKKLLPRKRFLIRSLRCHSFYVTLMSCVREMVNITVLYRSKIENSRKNLETCDCRGRQSMYPSGCIFFVRIATDNDPISLFQNYHLPLFVLCSLIRLQQSRFWGVLPVVVCHRRCFTESINLELLSYKDFLPPL